MSLYVVIKKTGEPAELLPAPEVIDLPFIQGHLGGYFELLPTKALVSEVLRGVTIMIDEDGKSKGLPDNLKLEFDIIRGPILVTFTDDETGDDHGLPRDRAEAVAKALDHYGVGIEAKAN